jgi:hypothetical protein
MDDVIEDGGVEDRRGIEFFAGDGGADNGEDAGADDGSDAEGGERERAEGLLEPLPGLFRFGNELVDGLAGKDLAWQGAAPLLRDVLRG